MYADTDMGKRDAIMAAARLGQLVTGRCVSLGPPRLYELACPSLNLTCRLWKNACIEVCRELAKHGVYVRRRHGVLARFKPKDA